MLLLRVRLHCQTNRYLPRLAPQRVRPEVRTLLMASLCITMLGSPPRTDLQPGVRNAHAMVYDESAGRVVMYGGADERQIRGDTWAWDVNARQWQQLATEGPPPRSFPSFAYDAARNEAVLFGGNRVLFGTEADRDTILGDTWVWRGGRWSQRIVDGPHARSEAALAYDRKRRRVVLFGGYHRDGSRTVRLGDTWEWDGTSWTAVAASGPEPRSGAAMAYDEGRKRVVLFGGSGRPPGTWEWNGRAWRRLESAGAPPSLFNPAMTFDRRSGALLRFGGWTGSARIAETWLLHPAGWTMVDASGPVARNHAAVVFDRRRGRALLFGGHDGEFVFGDVWEWAGRAWTRVLDEAPRRRVNNGH
jgi:hypothetical protein